MGPFPAEIVSAAIAAPKIPNIAIASRLPQAPAEHPLFPHRTSRQVTRDRDDCRVTERELSRVRRGRETTQQSESRRVAEIHHEVLVAALLTKLRQIPRQ